MSDAVEIMKRIKYLKNILSKDSESGPNQRRNAVIELTELKEELEHDLLRRDSDG